MARSIGLVLGAGGLTGHAYHAGSLAALVDIVGWDPRTADVIIGTSAGASVAAMLRADVSANDQFARATGQVLSIEGQRRGLDNLPTVDLPTEAPTLPQPGIPGSPRLLLAAIARRNPRLALAGIAPDGDHPTSSIGDLIRSVRIDDPPWPEAPLWITAVRSSDGKRTVFGRDDVRIPDVAMAVEASCAVPGQMTPVQVGEHTYVDGGVHSATNADLAQGLGLDLVVVIAPLSTQNPMVEFKVPQSIDDVADLAKMATGLRPSTDEATRSLHHHSLHREVDKVATKRTQVVVLEPTAADVEALGSDAMDRSRTADIAERAYESARVQLLGDTRFAETDADENTNGSDEDIDS